MSRGVVNNINKVMLQNDRKISKRSNLLNSRESKSSEASLAFLKANDRIARNNAP